MLVYILIEKWEALGESVHNVYLNREDADRAKETLDFAGESHDMFIESRVEPWDVSV